MVAPETATPGARLHVLGGRPTAPEGASDAEAAGGAMDMQLAAGQQRRGSGATTTKAVLSPALLCPAGRDEPARLSHPRCPAPMDARAEEMPGRTVDESEAAEDGPGWTADEESQTPEELACLDIDFFMERYFVTNGQPDRNKTTEPLILNMLKYPVLTLDAKLREVPGLHLLLGGWHPHYFTCVGWDFGAVEALTEVIRNQVRDEQLEKQRRIWAAAMHEHRLYMDSFAASPHAVSESNHGAHAPAFDLRCIRGSYALRCAPVTENWPKDRVFTLDICSGAGDLMVGAFDFGMIRGDMLLCLSNERLDEMVDTVSDEEEMLDQGQNWHLNGGYEGSNGSFDGSSTDFDSSNVSDPSTGSNGTTNGVPSGPPNGPSNDSPNGASSGFPNGASNGSLNGASNGSINGASNGASDNFSNGASNNFSNGASNNFSNGASNNFSNGASNNFSNGASNNFSNGASNNFSNGASNNLSNGAPNNFSNGALNNFSNGASNNFANGASDGHSDRALDDASRAMLGSAFHRVYYRMNGYETDEGQLFGVRAGHLDFVSDGMTTFDGLAYFFPYLARNVTFQGFRVSNNPREPSGPRPNLWWVS